ncbi:uncharacterized protein KY384_006331 [Bacidia gigantensis]|uniref:uncharacterized protein n=1 Tax=Bacidia gigantensis TaxID=2732470 RepID=UPI001D04473E|nr:uncharacterized protein KY384_006331 [Bacidia gigantensis]KAG8528644.1 hypothetical protein KY384_006331 [Bacidia gigantensis]
MSSRNASPAPSKTKVTVQGGVAGKGASSTLEDLDAAIRALEFQTNPTLSTTSSSSSSSADRTCTCNATRHPLSTVAPNCLNCGKIICLKEGIGPCTFCSTPLLSSAQIVDMLDSLKQERGAERMRVNNAGHARPATTTIASSSSTLAPAHSSSSSAAAGVGKADETLNKAEEHRNRLLAFQRENAKRTTVHDEAADYETTTSSWASPAERARQLQRQLKVKREQDWAARPEWEKRGKVLSINLGKGGRSVGLWGWRWGRGIWGKKTKALRREKWWRRMGEEGERGTGWDIIRSWARA